MYRTKGRPTGWHGMTWDERETELGCQAAVSLTKQWAGHFHLFSTSSASLRCAIVPWKMSTAADSSFSVDICHGSLGASNFVRLFDTVLFLLLFRATCNSCECSPGSPRRASPLLCSSRIFIWMSVNCHWVNLH